MNGTHRRPLQAMAACLCLAVLLITAAHSAAQGAEPPRPYTSAERAIAAAKAQMAIADAGAAQFKAVILEDGYQVWVDHVAGYRRVVTLSRDFRVTAIGPKLPVAQRRYFRCCGMR